MPAEHKEMTIADKIDVPMESMVAFENNLLNEIIIGLRKIGLLKFLYSNQVLLSRIAHPNEDTGDEVIYISAVSGGQRLDVRSQSDYLAASYSAVAFAEIALEKQLTGMNIPAADDITLDEVVEKSDGVMRIVDSPSL